MSLDRLPRETEALLKRLDGAVKAPEVTAEALATDEARLRLMEQKGKRALVDQLLATFKRQTQEEPHGTG